MVRHRLKWMAESGATAKLQWVGCGLFAKFKTEKLIIEKKVLSLHLYINSE